MYNRDITKERLYMTTLIEVEYIESEYPLGTTDGLNWTVYPR